ncbi:MAG: CehA/McbA family metallohydrolase [Planctomycetota bacterium]
MSWFYGNLHCHSTLSDGDSPPGDVARFYRENGFDFVAITDHNHRTGPEDCGPPHAGFTVLGACEYSANADGRPLHINGIGVHTAVAPAKDGDEHRPAMLRAALAEFRAQGAFTILNHPNWHWDLDAAELLSARGAHALELWNGSLTCNNLGDEDHPSVEALWDAVLTAGHRLWAVASDDCHRFGPKRNYRTDPPFSGWIGVDAASNSARDVVAALSAGHFYASNGPRLVSVVQQPNRYAVEVEPWDMVAHRLIFIGAGGRELARMRGLSGSYVPRGDEGYVRCRIETGQGLCAWTQPMFLA